MIRMHKRASARSQEAVEQSKSNFYFDHSLKMISLTTTHLHFVTTDMVIFTTRLLF